jgi:hypothetical protein
MMLKSTDMKSHFTVQAAKASWIIPIITIGIMVVGRSAFNAQFGALLLGGIIILFLVIGIILGIIGLFGCKRHGPKATVIPSLIGILLNGGLLSLLLIIAVTAFNARRMGG